jgi:hypothetical protein
MADQAAWVDMDEILPVELQSLPAIGYNQQPESRHKHIILWPDECEAQRPAPKTAPASEDAASAGQPDNRGVDPAKEKA